MPGLAPGPHVALLEQALDVEAAGQRALLAGDRGSAAPLLLAASGHYLASFDCAPPGSWGRLIGALKAAVLAGDGADLAGQCLARLDGAVMSAPAGYATAIAHLVRGDDAAAVAATESMRAGDGAFVRAADAIGALGRGDGDGYAAACRAIVADFAAREEHLTGVAIADTAAMLEVLARPRGLACRPDSPLMPPP